MKFTDGPLKEMLRTWISEFRKSEFAFESYDSQLADYITEKLQRSRKPELLNPVAEETWKHCYLCGSKMNPKYDPDGTATCGGNCCGR